MRWNRWIGLAACCLALPAWSATYDAAINNGTIWLTQQRNQADGSWGSSDAVKYLQTSEAVMALGALNQLSPAYYGGVAWLGNHAPSNTDFTSRRVLALGVANHSVAADLQFLQSTQNLLAPGNNGWGLSGTYQGSPLDTSLSLQALTQQSVATNVTQAVTYLTASQLSGSDSGWALGQETVSDPVTTAQVIIALVPLKSVSSAVPIAITNGLAALNAKVTSASPPYQIALAVIANLRNDSNSVTGANLLNGLTSQQATDGSWGEDPYATAMALRAVATGAGRDLATQKQTVSVPDNALRRAINAALGHGALDTISLGQMRQLTNLNASGLGITNLTGLQYATNLTTLDVSNNNISSFVPVAGLTNTAINEIGNPGYVASNGGNDNDVPTLPEWGAILMAALLMLAMARAQRRR